jgi:hypothetical protein
VELASRRCKQVLTRCGKGLQSGASTKLGPPQSENLNSIPSAVSRWRADSVVVLSDGSLHTGEVPLFGQEYFSQGLTYFCLTGASEGAGDQIGWVRTV